jgi:predicted solute-binding protein
MSYYVIFILSIIILINLFNTSYSNCNDILKINKLIRQTSRWAVAADQDINPYIANLHATYALGYLMALREIYSDETIKNLVKIDVRQLEIEVTKIMDNAVKKLIQICPDGQPKNKYLSVLAKEAL